MIETKSATAAMVASAKSPHPERVLEREDLRLDCLRLAAQRQGARDSRSLLEIADEYFHWVTAESVADGRRDGEIPIAPDAIDWSDVKAAPAKRPARLSLGRKSDGAKTKGKSSSRNQRAPARD